MIQYNFVQALFIATHVTRLRAELHHGVKDAQAGSGRCPVARDSCTFDHTILHVGLSGKRPA
jgi:hypothetical protein